MSLILALLLSQLRVLDEGVTKGMASQVNCTGTGVTCTVNPTGVIWTLSIPGSVGTGLDPAACAPGQYVTDQDAAGALTCSTPPGTYTLPIASPTVLGGVKVGSRLTMTGDVLSADVQTMAMDLTIPTYTRASVPACDSAWLSNEIRIHDAGQEDQTWVCLLDNSGAYAWTIYSQAPNVLTRTMANGTQFVTVGQNVTFTPGGAGAVTVNSTGASEPPCVTFETSNKQYVRCVVSVGATAMFNKIRFRISPGLTMGRLYNDAEEYGGAVQDVTGYCQAHATGTMPYGDVCVQGGKHNHVSGAVDATGGTITSTTGTVEHVSLFTGEGDYLYQWGNSGTYTVTPAPTWVAKGWAATADTGPAPGDVADHDFYWMTFPVILVSRCLPTFCGSAYGHPGYSSGALTTPSIIVEGVE